MELMVGAHADKRQHEHDERDNPEQGLQHGDDAGVGRGDSGDGLRFDGSVCIFVDSVDDGVQLIPHGVHGVFDHVGAALGTGEFGHVRGGGVDDGILVAAGVDDAGDAEFGAVVIHDVGRDAAVFRGLRGLFALRSLRTLRALRGRFCRFS